jgi:VIT1/CCC1 family predicted Fe2+/Mn2+ transporter
MTRHSEQHRNERIGWLRAAVLGANDGIISTSCLLLGVAAAQTARSQLLTAGIAALVAGAMSMAAGEYVSVSSQGDAEEADLDREREELRTRPVAEHRELAAIYVSRGVSPDVAAQVAQQLMEHDALSAHARDELGIQDGTKARPTQAAVTSAVTFSSGAALPLLTAAIAPATLLLPLLAVTSLLFLIVLGWLGARAGNAPPLRAAIRVGCLGMLAMAVTTGIGNLLGSVA